MIPLWALVRITPEGGRPVRLWLPLFLVWLLLLPLALLLLPVFAVWCAVRRINLFPAVVALYAVIGALRGTHVEITANDASVLVHIY